MRNTTLAEAQRANFASNGAGRFCSGITAAISSMLEASRESKGATPDEFKAHFASRGQARSNHFQGWQQYQRKGCSYALYRLVNNCSVKKYTHSMGHPINCFASAPSPGVPPAQRGAQVPAQARTEIGRRERPGRKSMARYCWLLSHNPRVAFCFTIDLSTAVVCWLKPLCSHTSTEHPAVQRKGAKADRV